MSKTFIVQMDYGSEGKTEPVFCTENYRELDAFIAGAQASQGTRVYASECDGETGEITPYTNGIKK